MGIPEPYPMLNFRVIGSGKGRIIRISGSMWRWSTRTLPDPFASLVTGVSPVGSLLLLEGMVVGQDGSLIERS